MGTLGELEGDATLLDELLLLLDDAPPADLSLDLPPPATPSRKRLPARPNPHKRQVESLEREVAALSEELARLRGGATHAQELAQEARWKRRRAEDECERLRAAVAQQAHFLRGLRSVFSAPLPLSTGLNGYRLLHKPSRLPRDRALRRQEYSALADEARLHRAVDLLCRETESLTLTDLDEPLAPSLDDPFIMTALTSDRAGFHVTATFVYAVPTRDVAAAARGVWVAFRDSSIKCCAFKSTRCNSHIVDPDATTALPVNVHYRIEGIQYQNDPQESGAVVGEARSVTFSRETDESAVVLWDFVDEDELHPLRLKADVTRKAVGSCFIRRELCGDGVERAVCRGLFTRRFELCEGAPQSQLEQFKEVVGKHMQGCELLFRQSIVDSIEAESAAYAKVVHALRVSH